MMSAGDLEALQGRLSKLEADMDEFSTSLSQLFQARRLSSGSSTRSTRSISAHRVNNQPVASPGSTSPQLLRQSVVMAMITLTFAAAATILRSVWLKKISPRAGRNFTAAPPPTTADARRSRQQGRGTANAAGDAAAACDVAFLAHPGVILSAFARWLPEERPTQRWQASWWMIPAWPVVFLLSVWFAFLAPLWSGPYLLADRFELEGVTNQVWLSRAFGYHFMIKALRRRIASGIEAVVREADGAGVSVLGLGALNKAEFINRGGEEILRNFTPRKTRLVHGNTLTAAVVVENVKATVAADPAAASGAAAAADNSSGSKSTTSTTSSTTSTGNHDAPCVFLTGATSKVGRAVALRLALDGFKVVCCTSSDERYAYLQQELAVLRQQQQQHQPEAASAAIKEGGLARARRVDEGVYYRLWVVGKFDTSVRLHVPLLGSAIVFAVPCPLEGYRPDVSTVTGGIVRMDDAHRTPRRFHVLLPHDQLYACHAAAIVHHRMGWMHHEVGKVDVGRMKNILHLARECGFSVPRSGVPLLPPYPTAALATAAAAAAPPRVAGDGFGAPRTRHSLATGGSGGGIAAGRPGEREEENDGCPRDGVGHRRLSLPRPRGVSAPARETGGGGKLTEGLYPLTSQPSKVLNAGGAFDEGAVPGEQRPLPAFCRVVVVGAGASGLSAAACLRTRGENRVVVLERSASVCGAWSRQYEGLRITTRRAHCGLPGWPVPREGFCEADADTTAASDDNAAAAAKSTNPTNTAAAAASDDKDVMSAQSFVRYLRAYRRRFDLDVFTDTEVLGADRDDRQPSSSLSSSPQRWLTSARGTREVGGSCGGLRVRFRRRGDKNVSVIRCDHLVIASGKCSSPRRPPAVLQSLRGFSGEVLHSSEVSGLAPRAVKGGGVCIIGMGNSACDLAVALLAAGADEVHISTRSAPPIIMRQWGPLSLEWVSRAVQFLPLRAVDQVLSLFATAKWGVGWRRRIFPPGVEQTWSACASNRVPCIDKGSLVPALLRGKIIVHGPVDWANGTTLRFRHSGAIRSFDTVILATGFDSLADNSWVDPTLLSKGRLRGDVHMVGFDNGRALLPLRQIGADARRIAARIVPRARRLSPRMGSVKYGGGKASSCCGDSGSFL